MHRKNGTSIFVNDKKVSTKMCFSSFSASLPSSTQKQLWCRRQWEMLELCVTACHITT